MPYPHRTWLYNNFGGLPGLLLQAAVALRIGIASDPLQEPQYEAILTAYEHWVTRGLGPAAEVLEPLCVLPICRIPAADADLQVLCRALGIDVAKVSRHFELLKAGNLIEQVGFRDNGYFQVTPPLLARRIAKRIIPGLSARLPTLYGQLSPGGRAGLVRRVAELQDEQQVQGFLSWLFHESGLFANIQSVASNAASIRALAETIPVPTGRQLRCVLEQSTREERRAALAGGRRWLTDRNQWEIISALTALVYRKDTFEDGARGLLCLAEVDNEGWANNAARIFTEIFHWRDPDIPKDARLRARLLSALADADSPRKRRAVAKAATHCLKTEYVGHVWTGQGVAPPEPGWRARLWKEVHEAVRRAVEVLKQLATDVDLDVRHEAIHGLCTTVGGIVALGLGEEATAQWGDDSEVRMGVVRSVVSIRHGYGDKAETLQPRLEELEKLASHPAPLIQDVVHQAKEEILREMKS